MSIIANNNKHFLNQCLEKKIFVPDGTGTHCQPNSRNSAQTAATVKKVEYQNPGSITNAGCVNADAQLNYLPITH